MWIDNKEVSPSSASVADFAFNVMNSWRKSLSAMTHLSSTPRRRFSITPSSNSWGASIVYTQTLASSLAIVYISLDAGMKAKMRTELIERANVLRCFLARCHSEEKAFFFVFMLKANRRRPSSILLFLLVPMEAKSRNDKQTAKGQKLKLPPTTDIMSLCMLRKQSRVTIITSGYYC